jgi:hypothetical protein
MWSFDPELPIDSCHHERSVVISVIDHEIAAHPMGARDDRVSVRRTAISGFDPILAE